MAAPVRITDAAGRVNMTARPPGGFAGPSLSHTLAGLEPRRPAGGPHRLLRPPELAATVPAGGTRPGRGAGAGLQPDLVLMDMEEEPGRARQRPDRAGCARVGGPPHQSWRRDRVSSGNWARSSASPTSPRRRAGCSRPGAGSRSWRLPIPVLYPVWRQPYATFNRNTYIAALLRGYAASKRPGRGAGRYFSFETAMVPGGTDLQVLLPTEPCRP